MSLDKSRYSLWVFEGDKLLALCRPTGEESHPMGIEHWTFTGLCLKDGKVSTMILLMDHETDPVLMRHLSANNFAISVSVTVGGTLSVEVEQPNLTKGK